MINRLQSLPPVRWAAIHPRIAAWIVLSAGMVLLLLIEAQGVGLLIGQWIALIVAVIGVAGLCVWIISWEDEDAPPEATAETTAVMPAMPEAQATEAAIAPPTDETSAA